MSQDISIHEAEFRKNFEQYHAASGASFESFAPLYAYGFRMAQDPRYEGRDFYEVEPEFKQAYEEIFPGSDWNDVSSAVLFGWEKGGGIAADRFTLI